jgi:hypothetical protein
MTALWQLIAPKAAAFIVGHNHCYERQNPRNAAGTVVSQSQGCVPITNGAGGRSLNAFGTGYSPAGAINVENATLFGFLKLALTASSCVIEFWSCGTDGLQTPSVFDTVTLLANNVHTATVSGGGALTVAGRKGARRATTVAGGGALTVTTILDRVEPLRKRTSSTAAALSRPRAGRALGPAGPLPPRRCGRRRTKRTTSRSGRSPSGSGSDSGRSAAAAPSMTSRS